MIVGAHLVNQPLLYDAIASSFDPHQTFELFRFTYESREKNSGETQAHQFSSYLRFSAGETVQGLPMCEYDTAFIPMANEKQFNYVLHVEGEIRQKNKEEIEVELARARENILDPASWKMICQTFRKGLGWRNQTTAQIDQKLEEYRNSILHKQLPDLMFRINIRCLAFFPISTQALVMKLNYPEMKLVAGVEHFDINKQMILV